MKKTPRQATTFNQICALKRDNWATKTHWFMVGEGSVHIGQQESGKPADWVVAIPRKVFNRFVDLYNGVKR